MSRNKQLSAADLATLRTATERHGVRVVAREAGVHPSTVGSACAAGGVHHLIGRALVDAVARLDLRARQQPQPAAPESPRAA